MMPTQSRHPGDTNDAATPRRLSVRTMLASMAVVELLSGIIQGYLVPLLPSLGASLNINSTGQTQIYLLSQLAFAIWTPLLAKLGDAHGYRRLLRVSIGMVTAGALLMAVWPNSLTLSIGVVLEAAVVGFMPLLIGIMRHREPQHRRAGTGILVGVLTAAVGIGGVVSGAFSEHSATLGLWVAVPVAALAVVAGLILPHGPPGTGDRIPWPAFTLMALGLAGIVAALSLGSDWGWSSRVVITALAVGLLAIAGWVAVERRARIQLVNLRMLRNPSVAIVSVITFCLAFSTIGFFGANSVFLGASPEQNGFGLSYGPLAIALIVLALNVVALGSSLSTATLLRKIGERYTLTLSGVVIAACFVFLLLWHDSVAQYSTAIVLLGLGFGGYQSSTRTLCVEGVPEQDTGIAAGINELALSLGSAFGSAIIGAIMSAHQTSEGVTLQAFTWLWTVCAVVALVGAGLGLFYRTREVTQ